MYKNNRKKAEQLGMPHGTATHRLRKAVMFRLLQRLDEDVCYRCEKKIESVDELSMDHKTPWQSDTNPIKSSFDLDNIAFSHVACNSRAASGGGERWKNHIKQSKEDKLKKAREYSRMRYMNMNPQERLEYNEYMREYMRRYRDPGSPN